MDEKIFWAIIVGAFTILIFIAMWWGWRGRSKRQSGLIKPSIPTELGNLVDQFTVNYVATSRAENPLERINTAGLGFRGRASLEIYAAGILLNIAGNDPFFIPVKQLREVGTATWTIDRVVESDGLVKVNWLWNDEPVETYLRTITAQDGVILRKQLTEYLQGV